MEITFYKYHGAGNDFILVDNRGEVFPEDRDPLIASLCARHTGIGADGLILIEQDPEADFRMIYFNCDGKEASMCGNGGRCAVHLASALGIIQKTCRFKAFDGMHQGEIVSENLVRISMRPVLSFERKDNDLVIDSGSPHYLVWKKMAKSEDITGMAREIRYSPAYREDGINVDYMQKTGPGQLFIKTYERGVEAETLACGTGVVASALGLALREELYGYQKVAVDTLGGRLWVEFERTAESIFRNIRLTGPVISVFTGRFSLPFPD